ncbi:MAG: tetratricopeptide repeat protein [Acidobacteriota bacterium]|nr:tetratricopeptide repeat protein [Acidobacteriota bacterium]
MKAYPLKSSLYLVVMSLMATLAQADWQAGVTAFQAGNMSAAAAEFQAIVKEQPEWPGGHKMLGLTYLKMKKGREAVDSLKRAYELSPEDPSVQIYLGEAYIATGRHGDAAAFLSKVNASSLDAKQQGYLARLRATALAKSGQSDRALAEFAKAVRANPNDADLQFQYGTAAYNAGDTNTAVSALAKAVQLDPADADKQKAYAVALIRQGRLTTGSTKAAAYQKAVAAAQRVVAANGSFDNLILLGGAQMGAKQYDSAVATLQKASAKNPNDWLPDYDIGRAHIGNGQFRSAESALKNALNKAAGAGDQKDIWKQLAYSYEKQQKLDDAILAYNRAGDSAGAARVTENRNTLQYNKDVEAEADEIRRLQQEQEAIRKQLEELPGGPPPGS